MRKSKEHFRHEWKYLINRAEKQLTDLQLKGMLEAGSSRRGRQVTCSAACILRLLDSAREKRMQVY